MRLGRGLDVAHDPAHGPARSGRSVPQHLCLDKRLLKMPIHQHDQCVTATRKRWKAQEGFATLAYGRVSDA